MIRLVPILSLAAAGFLSGEVPTQRVGQPLVITEIYLPGEEVKPKPRRDREPPLVVRVLDARPAKDGGRYDFEVHGLEPGTFNLADFLEGEGELPEILLEITSPLEPGVLHPHPLERGTLPSLGGYRTTMTFVGAAWLAGLIGIIAWRKKKPVAENTDLRGPTLAERLRPLVSGASQAALSTADRAVLERMIIGHWREALPEISSKPPDEAMSLLRRHPQASPLILALERWLHAPAADISPAEIESLLAPYA